MARLDETKRYRLFVKVFKDAPKNWKYHTIFGRPNDQYMTRELRRHCDPDHSDEFWIGFTHDQEIDGPYCPWLQHVRVFILITAEFRVDIFRKTCTAELASEFS